MNNMFKLFFAAFFVSTLFYCSPIFAQQNHFVYIQSDDKQPFSVNLNGKSYNSSDIGYVIIPKLADGKYQLNVTFPENKFPDQQFYCVVNKNDIGYALKNFKEKGWGLFNLQTLDVTMAGAAVADIPKDTSNPNAFGEMLSDVVNDTTLKTAALELQAAEKKKQEQSVIETNNQPPVAPTLNDSLLAAQKQVVHDSTATAPGLTNTKTITKIAEYTTDAGTSMEFLDAGSGDTIKIFLPNTSNNETVKQEASSNNATDNSVTTQNNNTADSSISVIEQKPDTTAAIIQGNTTDSSKIATDTKADSSANAQSVTATKEEDANPIPDTTVTENKQPNNPFYNKEKKTDTAKEKTVTDNEQATVQNTETASPSLTGFKQDCKKMFSDNDLDKVKKKMVSSSNDDKMIQTAKKYFEDKCLTTEQVKSLGALFLTDDARYNFFDAVYKNVYDYSSFASLENQLIDPYYKKRFRAMLK